MTTPTHLLIVEDDPAIARSLREGLERDGYRVTHAANDTDGIAHAQEHSPQLIILDMRLSDMLGLRQPINSRRRVTPSRSG
jgi:DNA-binding response OmpR family regulator